MNKSGVFLGLYASFCLVPAFATNNEGISKDSLQNNDYGSIYDKRSPELSEITTKYVGDRMLSQGIGVLRDCLRQKTYRKPFRAGVTWRIKGHVCLPLKAKKSKKNSTRYVAMLPNAFNEGKSEGVFRPVDIKYNKKKNTYKYTINGYTVKEFSEEEYTKSFRREDYMQIVPDSLQQTIEYLGKDGDVLTFIYSEFINNLAKPAFTREFKADLSEGNVGAFKGAVFEVIKATNAEITYKILRFFPEQS